MTGSVHLLLDVSAVVAYCRGSIHVGETIGEVADGGFHFAVHEVTLAAASLRIAPDQTPMLGLLVAHSRCLAPLTEAVGWRRLVQATRLYGALDRGLVALAATTQSAYILTAHPEAYKNLPTIAI